jgi:hypothetical protein
MDCHDEVTHARRTERIATLNDELRKTGSGGRTVLTRAVAALPPERLTKLLTAVRQFKDFNGSNDLHGERDMAFVRLDGDDFAWKIDYYDSDLSASSLDPADEAVTCRLLTIMTADDL